jgi:hypothetical protein
LVPLASIAAVYHPNIWRRAEQTQCGHVAKKKDRLTVFPLLLYVLAHSFLGEQYG